MSASALAGPRLRRLRSRRRWTGWGAGRRRSPVLTAGLCFGDRARRRAAAVRRRGAGTGVKSTRRRALPDRRVHPKPYCGTVHSICCAAGLVRDLRCLACLPHPAVRHREAAGCRWWTRRRTTRGRCCGEAGPRMTPNPCGWFCAAPVSCRPRLAGRSSTTPCLWSPGSDVTGSAAVITFGEDLSSYRQFPRAAGTGLTGCAR